jgi:hypothetical protein
MRPDRSTEVGGAEEKSEPRILRLGKPEFRALPTIIAVAAAFPLAGAIRMIPNDLNDLYNGPGSMTDRILMALFMPFMAALRTVASGGFPYLDMGRENLYPLIVPICLVLLAMSSGWIKI